jgi:hypothetical protein
MRCRFELDTGPGKTECAVEIDSTLDRLYLNPMIITAKQEYCNHDVRLFRYGLCNDAFSIEDYFVDGRIIGE